MTIRIGTGPAAGAGPDDGPPAPPPRGPRVNGAARRLTAEVPESSGGGASPPRPVLMAAGALAILTLALSAGARLSGRGHVPIPVGAVDVAMDFRFEDTPTGDVVVHARGSGAAEREVAVLHQGELMFVRGTLRALVRGRRQRGESDALPFRVTRYRDGRLTLDDMATRQHLELSAYGPSNAAAFGQLLDAAGAARTTAAR